MINLLNATYPLGVLASEVSAFELPDLALSRQLSISNDDFGGGGGGRADFLNALFPLGGTPKGEETIQAVIDRHDLSGRLDQGEILYSTQPVPNYKIPRLRALFRLRAPCEAAVRTMRDIDQWAKWMPRFKSSSSRPAGAPGFKYQEARMEAAGLTIHYQILIQDGLLRNGARSEWRIENGGFKKDFLMTVGLEVNDGFWGFFPVPQNPDETYAAYAIHTQPTTLLPGVAARIERSTIAEFPEFPTNLQSRALSPSWTKKDKPVSVGRDFRMISSV